MDRTKNQSAEIHNARGLPEDVIVSPDALRDQRIPPGQSRTLKWPVLDASGPPVIDPARWRFKIAGLVGTAKEWCVQEFLELPRRKVFGDFHCVSWCGWLAALSRRRAS
jgi:DMSO/TMAO reductase YedYZ molybdopterin-dependent catalytic subunit